MPSKIRICLELFRYAKAITVTLQNKKILSEHCSFDSVNLFKTHFYK